MKDKATVSLFRKIKAALPIHEFVIIEKKLLLLSGKELEAFWKIISAGYPIKFAILNYQNLYEYVRDKNITYYDALQTVYSIYPGLNAGIFIKTKEWFELN